MNLVLIALLLLPLAQAPADPIAAGKAIWEGQNDCRNCHGAKGEGGLGPDLAGNQLTAAQFLRAVRTPWGIMPAFVPDKNVTDEQVGQVRAYLQSLPKVAEPSSTWFTQVPPNATPRQTLMISYGCGQCHGPVMGNPRRTAGGEGADFEWFKKYVYTHTTAPSMATRPHLRMGNYSRLRVPESFLQEIWQFMSVDQGLRVPVGAAFSAGVPAGNGITYTLTLQNTGIPNDGLTAENLTVTLPLPAGATVAATTGAGYQGVKPDGAVFQVPRLGPGDKQTYTITLSGTGAGVGIAKGVVSWAAPKLGDGSADQVAVTVPRPAQAP